MLNDLRWWLRPRRKIIRHFRNFVLDKQDFWKRRIFIDRGSKVLFMAHLDTVQTPKLVSATRHRIYAQGLDDRLGCMIASKLSLELGADLLLTDHEESAGTTARYHICKDYNWIVEFDRAGEDVVTYDLDSVEFRNAIRGYWHLYPGMYSDICELKTETCCMNLGIGYERAHSTDSYVTTKVFNRQIEAFRKFYAEYKDVEFKQDYSNFGTNCKTVYGSYELFDDHKKRLPAVNMDGWYYNEGGYHLNPDEPRDYDKELGDEIYDSEIEYVSEPDDEYSDEEWKLIGEMLRNHRGW